MNFCKLDSKTWSLDCFLEFGSLIWDRYVYLVGSHGTASLGCLWSVIQFPSNNNVVLVEILFISKFSAATG